MNKILRKILCSSLVTLLIASLGVGYTTKVRALAKPSRRISYHSHVKNTRCRIRAHHKMKKSKRIRRYNYKIKRLHHYKKAIYHQRFLKPRFKRSNNLRLLKRSGFFNAHLIGGNFIFDKYAPNDKRAVVPKRTDVNNWYKGKFGRKNPTAYQYLPKLHGWKILK